MTIFLFPNITYSIHHFKRHNRDPYRPYVLYVGFPFPENVKTYNTETEYCWGNMLVSEPVNDSSSESVGDQMVSYSVSN